MLGRTRHVRTSDSMVAAWIRARSTPNYVFRGRRLLHVGAQLIGSANLKGELFRSTWT